MPGRGGRSGNPAEAYCPGLAYQEDPVELAADVTWAVAGAFLIFWAVCYLWAEYGPG